MTTERPAGAVENVLVTTHLEFAGGTQSAVGGRLDRPVPVPVLLDGLREVCRLQPMLRARLAGAAPDWRFVFDQSFEDVEVAVEELGSRPVEEVLAAENDHYLDITKGPLWRTLVLTDGRGETAGVVATVVTYAHAIVDGVSVLAFMRQLIDAIHGRTAGREPMSTRPSMEDLLPRSAAVGDAPTVVAQAGEWAFDQVVDMAQRRTVIAVDYLDADDLVAIRGRCRSEKVKMDAFLVAVVQQALARTIPEALLVPAFCAFDVRNILEPAVPADEIGVYMKDFPLFDPAWATDTLTLWERAVAVSATLTERRRQALVEMAHYPVARICAEIRMVAGHPPETFAHSFSVSNMGRQPVSSPDGARFESVHLNSADRIGMVGVQAVFHEVDGALCVALSHVDPLISQEKATAVRKHVLAILRSAARSGRTEPVTTEGTA